MAVEILRPDSAGDVTSLPTQFPNSTFHWDKVDEVVADDDTTYVAEFSSRGTRDTYDLYNLEDSGVGAGDINKVTIYCISKGPGIGGNLHIKAKTHSTEYNYDKGIVSTSAYTSHSQELAVNPNTGNPWTWAEIDALQVGPRHECLQSTVRTTQVYIEVDYTLSESIQANPDAYNGYLSYVQQHIKNLVAGLPPLKLPDGTVW